MDFQTVAVRARAAPRQLRQLGARHRGRSLLYVGAALPDGFDGRRRRRDVDVDCRRARRHRRLVMLGVVRRLVSGVTDCDLVFYFGLICSGERNTTSQ